MKTNTVQLLQNILAAVKLEDIVDIHDLKKSFSKIAQQVHPDICSHPDASAAMAKLNALKELYEQGSTLVDDAGKIVTNGYMVTFCGDQEPTLLATSLENYRRLQKLTSPASTHLKRFLPKSMVMQNNTLVSSFVQRAIPLTNMLLEQDHVNWILSRMLEFSALLHQEGFVHSGLNPESVFVVPETHGIIVTSFYHMKPRDTRLMSISGRYQHWYPASVWDTKAAIETIDLELAKKTAIYLLGDHSGSGIKYKKTHHADFMDFVIAQDHDSRDAYTRYRALITKNFPKKFCPFNK